MPRVSIAKPRIATADTRHVRPPPKQADSFYSTPEYQQWRAIVIAKAKGRCQDPQCKAPHAHGRLYADHIIELRDGGPALDPRNGRAVCSTCHTLKTVAERAKRMAR